MKIKFLKVQEIFDTVLQHSNQRIVRVEVLEGKLTKSKGDLTNIFFSYRQGDYYIADFSSDLARGFFFAGQNRKKIAVNVSNFAYRLEEDDNGKSAKVYYHKDIDLPQWVRAELLNDINIENILEIDDQSYLNEDFLDRIDKAESDFTIDFIENNLYNEDEEDEDEDEKDEVIYDNSIYEDLEISFEGDEGDDDYERIDNIKEWVKNAKSSHKNANQNNNNIEE